MADDSVDLSAPEYEPFRAAIEVRRRHAARKRSSLSDRLRRSQSRGERCRAALPLPTRSLT